jgi:hypothetical protein
MKFTKPISREVDIDGETFVVSFDERGLDFRLKGKRRTAHVEWARVLEIAEGEQGASAREFLGLGPAQGQSQQGRETERTEQIFEPQSTTGSESREGDGLSRSVSAGDRGAES